MSRKKKARKIHPPYGRMVCLADRYGIIYIPEDYREYLNELDRNNGEILPTLLGEQEGGGEMQGTKLQSPPGVGDC